MARWQGRVGGRLSVVKSLFRFMWQERLWWMIPMIIVLLLVGVLLVVGQSTALAPFIYTLF